MEEGILTCKDCQAYVEDNAEEGSGVCIFNPPTMLAEKDPETKEAMIISAFPKVDGGLTRCMKLIAILLILFSLPSCGVMGTAWKNYVKQQEDKAHGRGYYTCHTRKNAYGRLVTECWGGR